MIETLSLKIADIILEKKKKYINHFPEVVINWTKYPQKNSNFLFFLS